MIIKEVLLVLLLLMASGFVAWFLFRCWREVVILICVTIGMCSMWTANKVMKGKKNARN